MKIRINEDYHFWCCDWCDSENRVLLTKLQDGANCGACHRPMQVEKTVSDDNIRLVRHEGFRSEQV